MAIMVILIGLCIYALLGWLLSKIMMPILNLIALILVGSTLT